MTQEKLVQKGTAATYFFLYKIRSKSNFNSLPGKKGDVKKGDLKLLLAAGKQLTASSVHRLPDAGHNPHHQPHGQILIFTLSYTLKFMKGLLGDV